MPLSKSRQSEGEIYKTYALEVVPGKEVKASESFAFSFPVGPPSAKNIGKVYVLSTCIIWDNYFAARLIVSIREMVQEIFDKCLQSYDKSPLADSIGIQGTPAFGAAHGYCNERHEPCGLC